MTWTLPNGSFLSRALDRLSPPEGLLLLVLSVVVGAGSGLASVFFVKLIFAIQDFSYGWILAMVPALGKSIYLIVPVAGGLLVGPLILFAQEAKGHGVPEVMQALILRGGRIRARVAAAKLSLRPMHRHRRLSGTGGSDQFSRLGARLTSRAGPSSLGRAYQKSGGLWGGRGYRRDFQRPNRRRRLCHRSIAEQYPDAGFRQCGRRRGGLHRS